MIGLFWDWLRIAWLCAGIGRWRFRRQTRPRDPYWTHHRSGF